MKKAILFVLLACLTGFIAQGQIKFGIKAGINSSSIKVDEVISSDSGDDLYEVIGSDATVGFHGGLMIRLQLSSFFLQPELLFSSTGGEVLVTDLINAPNVDMVKNQTFKKIDLPVMAGVKFGPVRVGLGPVGSYMIQSESFLDDLQDDMEGEFNKVAFGYQAGIGVDVWKLAVDLRYEGNLSKLGDGVTIGNYTAGFDTRNPQFLLSVGLFF